MFGCISMALVRSAARTQGARSNYRKLENEPADHAIGRSRGGLTTKIHAFTDALVRPVALLLTAGQSGDNPQLEPLLDIYRSQQHSLGDFTGLNKFDLGEPAQAALARLQPYIALGYPVIPVSAHHDIAPLRPYMAGQTSVFVGQSGMGKSSLINALAPDARTTVGEISEALDSGRHTTTSARMYALDATSRLIDSPGMQSFGLNHVQADQLDQLFVEFRPYIGLCKFNNCRHVHEPGCAVIAASARDQISPTRLAAYQAILASLSSPQR